MNRIGQTGAGLRSSMSAFFGCVEFHGNLWLAEGIIVLHWLGAISGGWNAFLAWCSASYEQAILLEFVIALCSGLFLGVCLEV